MSLFSKNVNPFSPYILLLLPSQALAAINDPPPNFDADDAALRTEQTWDAYNLPYGTLGMVAHVFLLYYLACHLDGRSPLLPWRKLEYDLWNIGVTVVTSIVTISLVAVNMSSEVRESRALMAMAVLQVLYSLVVDGVTLHRYFRDRRRGNGGVVYGVGEVPKVEEKREGLRWDLVPWLLILLVASVVNSQIMGTLTAIDRNPRLDGVTAFNSRTGKPDPTGLALVLCAMIGGVLAIIALALGGCSAIFCSAVRRDSGYGNASSKGSLIAVYIFSFFGLVSCLGFLLVADYAVGVVTGNAQGAPGKGKGSKAMYWAFFVFQYVPMFTF